MLIDIIALVGAEQKTSLFIQQNLYILFIHTVLYHTVPSVEKYIILILILK
jgi:hypothetical protein